MIKWPRLGLEAALLRNKSFRNAEPVGHACERAFADPQENTVSWGAPAPPAGGVGRLSTCSALSVERQLLGSGLYDLYFGFGSVATGRTEGQQTFGLLRCRSAANAFS